MLTSAWRYFLCRFKTSGRFWSGGVRPVLIIQNDVGNRHSPTVISSKESLPR